MSLIRYRWRGHDVVTDGRSFVAYGGMCWPLPQGDRSWRLRYSGPYVSGQPPLAQVQPGDTLAGATVMDAYEALLWKTPKEREEIVYAIRRALREGKRAAEHREEAA